jgi:hypothetical protein
MAFLQDVTLMANRALNRIEGLAGQAKSYSSSPVMLKAKSIASSIANTPSLKRNAIAGAVGGAAVGAGYDQMTNDRATIGSSIRAGITGGMYGGAGAAAATVGRSAYKNIGGRAGIAAYGRRAMNGVKDFRTNMTDRAEAVNRLRQVTR